MRLTNIYKEATPSMEADIGECVVVKFADEFHRGLILGFMQDSVYFVQLVDIGQHITCDKSALYHIREEFVELPVFAIRCSLNRIVPAFESTNEEKKLKYVTELVNRENLYPCKFYEIAKKRYMVRLKLDDSDLKTQLIEKNMLSNLPKSKYSLALVSYAKFF
jgi:Tudor domain